MRFLPKDWIIARLTVKDREATLVGDVLNERGDSRQVRRVEGASEASGGRRKALHKEGDTEL